MKIVCTLQELYDIVNNNMRVYNAIIIENVKVNFDIDFRTILKGCNICDFKDKDTFCVLKTPVRLFNITAPKMSFVNIEFNNEIYIGGDDNCDISNIYFCSCKFFAKERYSMMIDICDSLDLSDCYFSSNACISSNKPTKKIQIEDLICDGNLEFRNLKLISDNISHKAEAYIEGNVGSQVKFFNCFVINGDLIVNCNCSTLDFCFMNYYINDEEFIEHNWGAIHTNGVEIGLLNLYYCDICTIDIINTVVSNVHEYQLICENFDNEAATILHNAALQNNNDILANKYNAIAYDKYLREITAGKYKSMISYLSSNGKCNKKCCWIIKTIKELFRRYLYEPIILLLPNIFSSEGWLLWLNKYSNNYNRSWTRGVIFTLFTTLVFYFIINYCGTDTRYFIIDFKFHDFDRVVEGYLSLLDIFGLSSITQPMRLNLWGKILLFIAKIAIAFGSWQTIYAFYKYRRK